MDTRSVRTPPNFHDLSKQLEGRGAESLASLEVERGGDVQFLLSESDWGVTCNDGRMGARFGPRAILACLKKMSIPKNPITWETHSISDGSLEKDDFQRAQEKSRDTISTHLQNSHPRYRIQLGGGHDHIYPLLKGLERNGAKKILVINLDAHCDTRLDDLPHSGTPFRQFSRETETDFTLIQVGILPYANTNQTLSPLERGEMIILEDDASLESILSYKKTADTHCVISLDCDVLCSSIMEGVSAVNHEGIGLASIQKIFHWAQSHLTPSTYGIYEYNPVYDNLSQKGARALAALIYRTFFLP